MTVTVGKITEEMMRKVDVSTLKPNRPHVENNQLEILAGPILRYWSLADSASGTPRGLWRGSISYVTRDSGSNYSEFPPLSIGDKPFSGQPYRYANMEDLSFWRFDVDLETSATESLRVDYQLGNEHPQYSFWIPAQSETMRSMFYSCNGFSLAVDTKEFPGQLWEDVLRKHAEKPIHVMLGGGDQLYCDSINLILPENTLKLRGKVDEEPKMRELIDKFYLHQYVDWYGRGYWKGKAGETYQSQWVETLAQIPSLNIFDDHDIIDGYGTYRDRTMSSPIFEILGEYAFKHYMLFQQNVAKSGDDPKLKDESWICTNKTGPFIHEAARSICSRLGKGTLFLGLDCRTERKKTQVCAPSTYTAVFKRVKEELTKNPDIKHIYLMLGVPIAYPRMVWAENLMSSRLIGPIKWLSKKGIILKGLVNPFDGDVELLDDLNDHWCAKHHKAERNEFLRRLMDLQRAHSVRVTILTGDVHLCAVGVFKSIHKVEPENDHRFMVCPISSAIVNTPPPGDLANFLNHRNKTHILGARAAERMIPIFTMDTDGAHQGGNNTLMARRNYCLLDPVVSEPKEVEQYPGPGFEGHFDHKKHPPKHLPLVKVVPDSVKMTLLVEKDNHDKSATTVPYEMYIPALTTKSE